MGKQACMVLVLLVVSNPARANTQVVVAPPTIQPAVHVEPAFPAQFQDLSVGYRHEELPDLALDGFALRAVIGVPGLPVDGEGEMSGAWGYKGDDLVGHALISLGLRFVANKSGRVRPFVVAAPLLEVTRVSSDDRYGLGAAGGVGIDIVLPDPGLISFDVRGAQTWNPKNQAWSDWQVLATISIGLHVEPH